jgi:hypothetical protein
VDLFWLIFLPILAYAGVVLFQIPYVPASILFLGLPAGYLSYKKPQIIKKSLFFSLLMAITIVWGVDHMIFLDNAWDVPSKTKIINNTVPIADLLWFVLWSYFGLVFWEYFLDHDKNKQKFSPRIKNLIVLLGVEVVIFSVLYALKSPWLAQPYFYLKGGIVLMVLPILAMLLKFPKLLRKVTIIAIYFFVLSAIIEHAGLVSGHWSFPGKNYLGTITYANQILPLEEIIFWWALGIPGIICWYEFFADDRR